MKSKAATVHHAAAAAPAFPLSKPLEKEDDGKGGDPYPYASMRISSDISTAAGLRNGMSPRQVHEAIARLPNPPAIVRNEPASVDELPEYHKRRVPPDVLQMAGVTNGMQPRELDRAVRRVLTGG